MRRKRIWFSTTAVVLTIICSVVLIQSRRSEPTFTYWSHDYKVVQVKYGRGSNLILPDDYPSLQWGRRQLDRIGIHLAGSRINKPFSPTYISQGGCIAMLCRGPRPTRGEMSTGNSEVTSEFIDAAGRSTERFMAQGCTLGPPGHLWLFWAYDEVDFSLAEWEFPPPKATNVPKFRIVRKSDQKELLLLKLKETKGGE